MPSIEICRLGGKRRVELYGAPGNIEDRRKGGLVTQIKFRANPELAKKIGLKQRKKIKYPEKSTRLAEFVGILLGDGGIHTNYQVVISFNPKEDLEYAKYVQKLVYELFSISSRIQIRKKYGTGDIIISGRNLVEFLQQTGIKKGNKITNGVDLPQWIWDSEDYKIACLRGLMDTDGCFYRHPYVINDKRYTYLKVCFTSYSPPLLESVTRILKDLKLGPKNTAKNRVYLYSQPQVHRYLKIVGTSNPRYFDMYNSFCDYLKIN